jgi:hypothetical protein
VQIFISVLKVEIRVLPHLVRNLNPGLKLHDIADVGYFQIAWKARCGMAYPLAIESSLSMALAAVWLSNRWTGSFL